MRHRNLLTIYSPSRFSFWLQSFAIICSSIFQIQNEQIKLSTVITSESLEFCSHCARFFSRSVCFLLDYNSKRILLSLKTNKQTKNNLVMLLVVTYSYFVAYLPCCRWTTSSLAPHGLLCSSWHLGWVKMSPWRLLLQCKWTPWNFPVRMHWLIYTR